MGHRTLRKSSSGSSVTSLAPLEKNPLPNGLYATIPIPSSLKIDRTDRAAFCYVCTLASDPSIPNKQGFPFLGTTANNVGIYICTCRLGLYLVQHLLSRETTPAGRRWSDELRALFWSLMPTLPIARCIWSCLLLPTSWAHPSMHTYISKFREC